MGLNLVGGWLVWGQGCITWAISCCLHRCCCCWTMNWPCIHSSGYAWAGGQPTATAPRATSPAAACPGRCADHDWACTAPADHSYPHAPCGSCCGICMEWSAVFSVQCSNPFSFYLLLLLSLSCIAYLLHSYAAGGLNSCHSGLVHTSQAVGMWYVMCTNSCPERERDRLRETKKREMDE